MLPSDLPVIAVKFELDLNNEQTTKCWQGASIARFTYNWSLSHRISLIEQKKSDPSIKVPTAIAEHRRLNALKATEFPWMYDVSKCIPQEALRDLDKALVNFYEGRAKFPRFKKKHRCKSSFRLHGNCKTNPKNVEVQSRYVKLPTFGWVRSKEKYLDRRLKKLQVEQILLATVSEEANRWYCSLCVRIKPPTPIDHSTHPSAGVDLGILTFATISSNHEITKVPSLKPLAKSLKHLRKAQRAHCKKQKGSSNRRRSAKKLARLHARVRHQRQDFLHKQTTKLTKTKSVIGIEDLNVRGMSKHPHLARSILDQGFGEFRRQVTYKSTKFGSFLFVAPRFEPSSKKCYVCKHKLKKLDLSVRTWTCPQCGTVHDRDGNAAINLEDLANVAYREFLGNGGRKAPTPVEIPMAAEPKLLVGSTSYESLKQEVSTEVTSWWPLIGITERFFPGCDACIEFGWYSKWLDGKGWVRCEADDKDAGPDLNRLVEAQWDKENRRFVLPKNQRSAS
jgi:putative transposase